MIQPRVEIAPDRELLERFLRERDEHAFVALVQRHGAMVLGVCRSVLRHTQDAEDAFQACFLVLSSRGASIRNPDAVASWLHGVAYRLSLKKKTGAAGEPRTAGMDLDQLPSRDVDDLTWRELRLVLHKELDRLPEKLRCPLLLCYLEGKTQSEAARQLGWSNGVLRGRLIRGRKLLRRRLQRRGLSLGALLLAADLTPRVPLPDTVGSPWFRKLLAFGGGLLAVGLLSTVIYTIGYRAAAARMPALTAETCIENTADPIPQPPPTSASDLIRVRAICSCQAREAKAVAGF